MIRIILLLFIVITTTIIDICCKGTDYKNGQSQNLLARIVQGRPKYTDFQDYKLDRMNAIKAIRTHKDSSIFISQCTMVLDSVMIKNRPQQFFKMVNDKMEIERIYLTFEIGDAWDDYYFAYLFFSNKDAIYKANNVLNYRDSIEISELEWPEINKFIHTLIDSFEIESMYTSYLRTAHPEMDLLLIYDDTINYSLVSNCLPCDRNSREAKVAEFFQVLF